MPVGMCEHKVGERPTTRHSPVQRQHAIDGNVRSVVPFFDHCSANTLRINAIVPTTRTPFANHRDGTLSDGVPVPSNCPYVDAGAERRHLLARHARSEITAIRPNPFPHAPASKT